MTIIQRDSSSFRDPSGCIYTDGNKIYRTIRSTFAEEFQFVRNTGLIKQLIQNNDLLPEQIIDNKIDPKAAFVLQHPKLEVISYPYEWCFSALKAAALLHLKIHLHALQFDVTLIDSSSYNIQFIGNKPVFIDHLSFRRYREGDIWHGHQQFCQQFLNPLLLQAYCGVAFNNSFRGQPEGVFPETIRRLLPLHRKFLPNVFMHVIMQSSLQKTSASEIKNNLTEINLPKNKLINLLRTMQDWISNLKSKEIPSFWQNYTNNHSYGDSAAAEKEGLVKQFSQIIRPKLLIDIGCNIGRYAKTALQNGADFVIGCDSDVVLTDNAFMLAQTENLKFLPLVINMANPSPAQGWCGSEYKSFNERVKPEALLALAIIHHLVIGNNLSLTSVLDWLIHLAPKGLIEFIPKTDPMVQNLLLLRQDIFADYEEKVFMEFLMKHTSIVKKVSLPNSERFIVWYEKNV